MLWMWIPSTVASQDIRTILKPKLESSGIKYKMIYYDINDGKLASLPPASVYLELGPDDVLLAMGTLALKQFQQDGVLAKNRAIKSLRDNVWPLDEGHLVVSYQPTQDPQYIPLVQWDLELAIRQVKTGDIKPELGEYKWVEDFNEFVQQVRALYDETDSKVAVSLDLETIGLDPFYEGPPFEVEDQPPSARILSVSLSCVEGESHVYRVPKNGSISDGMRDQLQVICSSPKIKMVGANLKFDAKWMRHKWGIEIINQSFDTFLVGSMLNENIANSLNLHAKMYTSMGGYDDDFNRSVDKARMDLALEEDPDGFLTYAGGDTDVCLRVYNRQKLELIQDETLKNLYAKLVQRSSNVFTKLEHRGVVVDSGRYEELKVEVLAAHAELEAKGLAMIPKEVRAKHKEKGITLTRPALIKDYMFSEEGLNIKPVMVTPKSKQPSTAMDHLMMFEKHRKAGKFISCLKEFNSAQKTLSTYVTGFMRHIRSDGRFHPTYYLGHSDHGGTNTGRSSCKDPAYQTIPKHTIWAKPLRTVYTCPEGYVILKADFSQGELRITACVSGEENMIEAYMLGADLHLKSGSAMYGLTPEQAKELPSSEYDMVRQGGKVINFGLIYGMGAPGLVEFARTTYGVDLTLKAAKEAREVFFKTYPGLINWHDDYKRMAKAHGFVRSPLGRVRHLPMIYSRDSDKRAQAERQSINSPIQGCLSDMCQLAMCELDDRYPELWMFGFTHDEIQMYVPADNVDLWAGRVREVMENLPLEEFGWKPQIPFPVDIEVSTTNLAECERYVG